MNEMMNWAAHYNTLIIQVAFSIVLLLVLIYIYRLFFVSSVSSSGVGDGGTDLSEVNEKLNLLLKQGPTISSTSTVLEKSATESAGPANGSNPALQEELDTLKAENAQLKTQLNESEKKVFELTPASSPEDQALKEAAKLTKGSAEKGAASAIASAEDRSAEIATLNKKVEELQSRLSEYDIIADDIAELSQLRAENNELKKRLEGASGFESALAAVPMSEPAEDSPVLQSEKSPLASAESVVETKAPAEAAIASALPDIDIPEVKIEPEATPVEPEVPVGANTDISVDQTIPDTEKDLMNDFEKSQKG